MELDLNEWVSEADADRIIFRQAVHTILVAVAGSQYLKPKMVMKGGMLLGIRYKSSRFTEDIDFSASVDLSALEADEFKSELNEALLVAESALSYGVRCAVQSLNKQPKKNFDESTFPAFKITIGYAHISNKGLLARLDRGECPRTVQIDYSFNEDISRIEDININDDSIQVYNIYAIVAEKYRSILQQVVRKRSRRQDVYDLYYLMNNSGVSDYNSEEKLLILKALIEKSAGRFIGYEYLIAKGALKFEEVVSASRHEYDLLNDDVVDLPDFELAYNAIALFYDSLPWELMQ